VSALDADRKIELLEMIGAAPQMQEVFRIVHKVSQVDVTVLISGESGTGKELVARAIHSRSPRRGGPFVAVNCGAIPETLVESEFFGHEKGAFTGASVQHAGSFERASGGILFLDEVGELSLRAQTKILRALQERQISRLGGRCSVDVDVRVLAASNRNLNEEVRQGRFRDDLYWRLDVVRIELPPLRQRREDLPALIECMVERCERELGIRPRPLDPEAMRVIHEYDWPGNVRELENAISHALVLAEGPAVTPLDLPAAVRGELELSEPALESFFEDAGGSLTGAVERVTRRVELSLIRSRLEQLQGNRGAVAESLGISRKTLFNKMRQYGLGGRGGR
jgi:two-component system, NtrC family, response regulator AtoC